LEEEVYDNKLPLFLLLYIAYYNKRINFADRNFKTAAQMEENKGLLLKSAMTYGLAMGIFWVIKYLFFIFSNTVPALNIIYIVLTLTVPFIAYYLTKRYKQDIGGKISFFHAWRFNALLFCRIDLRPRTFRVLPVYRSGRFSGKLRKPDDRSAERLTGKHRSHRSNRKNQFHSYPYGYSGCFQ
jgi:hypothetical protein